MAYKAACRDVGVNCPGSFTTESRDELQKHIDLHLEESHPGVEVPQEEIEQAITEV